MFNLDYKQFWQEQFGLFEFQKSWFYEFKLKQY